MKQRKFNSPEAAAVFAAYPKKVRTKIMFLRQLIFDTAAKTKGVGALEEVLKWGEPSYLTPETKSGSTVRINWKESLGNNYAIYFKCTTNLVPTFKKFYPKFTYEKDRAIHFRLNEKIPVKRLSHCIGLALTYHLRKKLKNDYFKLPKH